MANEKAADREVLKAFRERLDERYVIEGEYSDKTSVGYSDSTGAIKTDYGVELNAGATIDGHLDEPFLFRPTAFPFNRDIITIGGQKATVKEVRAYAFVKNQLVLNGNFENNSGWVIQFATNIVFANNTLSLKNTSVSSAASIKRVATPIKVIANRKYLLLLDYNFDANIGTDIVYATTGGISIPSGSIICDGKWHTLCISATSNFTDNEFTLYFRPAASTGNLLQFRNYRLIDLTQWFNNDTTILSKTNETWFVPWFLNNFGKYIPTYSTGEIENTYATQITTNGVNQWDEEWEVGSISAGTGNNEPNDATIRSKNYIEVFQNTDYYFYVNGSGNIGGRLYDEQKNFIGFMTITSNNTFSIPINAHYLRFVVLPWYGTTYNNDIQICLHWTETEIEETYHPYEKWVFNIDWSAIGTPLGINSQIGDYKDFVSGKNGKVVGSVDLGTGNYNKDADSWALATYAYSNLIRSTVKYSTNNILQILPSSITRLFINNNGYVIVEFTAGTFNSEQELKAALSGVILQYELAEPTLTDMTESEKLTNTYNVNDYGTEEFDNVCALDVLYQNNLVRQIVNNQTAIADHEQRISALETEVAGIKGLPTAPSTNGNYRLRCTVADGVATYTWVAES